MKLYYKDENVTLYQGNCLEVLPNLSTSIDAVLTDPPYSSGGLHANQRQADPLKKYLNNEKYESFSGDNKDQHSFSRWLSIVFNDCNRVLKTGGYFFTFTDWRQLPIVTDIVQMADVTWRGLISWDKGKASRLPNPQYYRHQCEYVVWGSKGKLEKSDYRRSSYDGVVEDVLKVNTKQHPTEKPLKILQHCIEAVPKGSTVLDPFSGSGSTLIASLKSGRKAIGIELSEHYCEVAVNRIKEYYETKA